VVVETATGIPVPADMEVHHKNFIRDDDRPENLVVLTPSAHARIHAAHVRLGQARGEDCPKSILTEAQAQAILDTPRRRGAIAALAAAFGVSVDTAYNVRMRRTWKHLTPSSRSK